MTKKTTLQTIVATMLFAALVYFSSCYTAQITPHKMSWFGDTSKRDRWTPEMYDSIGMKPVKTQNKQFYFRWITDNEALDLWSDDRVQYHAKIVFYIIGRQGKKTRYFSSCYPLPDSGAKAIANVYNGLDIQHIPDFDSVKGHEHMLVFDDAICIYQCLDNQEYSEKQYYGTNAFTKTIPEAARIDSFNGTVDKIAQTQQRAKNFTNMLPPGTYGWGLLTMMICKPYDDDQSK